MSRIGLISNRRIHSPAAFSGTLLVLASLVASSCADPGQNIIYFHDLKVGEQVKTSGRKLIDRPDGIYQVLSEKSLSGDTILIAVHGFKSAGYEWVYPLRKMASSRYPTYFYRWNWELCPAEAAARLAGTIRHLRDENPALNRIILFGHSYGGVIIAALITQVESDWALEIHTVAAPLAGHPSFVERCEQSLPGLNRPDFSIQPPISLTQWRTQHKQDGAFSKLLVDPQVVDIAGSLTVILPDSMGGHRLGHNWSISWVVDQYFSVKRDSIFDHPIELIISAQERALPYHRMLGKKTGLIEIS